jgi:hypothetical protein
LSHAPYIGHWLKALRDTAWGGIERVGFVRAVAGDR